MRLRTTFITCFKYLLKHKLVGKRTVKGSSYNLLCKNIFLGGSKVMGQVMAGLALGLGLNMHKLLSNITENPSVS